MIQTNDSQEQQQQYQQQQQMEFQMQMQLQMQNFQFQYSPNLQFQNHNLNSNNLSPNQNEISNQNHHQMQLPFPFSPLQISAASAAIYQNQNQAISVQSPNLDPNSNLIHNQNMNLLSPNLASNQNFLSPGLASMIPSNLITPIQGPISILNENQNNQQLCEQFANFALAVPSPTTSSSTTNDKENNQIFQNLNFPINDQNEILTTTNNNLNQIQFTNQSLNGSHLQNQNQNLGIDWNQSQNQNQSTSSLSGSNSNSGSDSEVNLYLNQNQNQNQFGNSFDNNLQIRLHPFVSNKNLNLNKNNSFSLADQFAKQQNQNQIYPQSQSQNLSISMQNQNFINNQNGLMNQQTQSHSRSHSANSNSITNQKNQVSRTALATLEKSNQIKLQSQLLNHNQNQFQDQKYNNSNFQMLSINNPLNTTNRNLNFNSNFNFQDNNFSDADQNHSRRNSNSNSNTNGNMRYPSRRSSVSNNSFTNNFSNSKNSFNQQNGSFSNTLLNSNSNLNSNSSFSFDQFQSINQMNQPNTNTNQNLNTNQININLTPEQCKNNIIRLTKTHSGSRFIQQQLTLDDDQNNQDSPNTKEKESETKNLFKQMFITEIFETQKLYNQSGKKSSPNPSIDDFENGLTNNIIVELMCDNFSHFAIEKLIQKLDSNLFSEILKLISPFMYSLSCHKFAAFSIQTIIDTIVKHDRKCLILFLNSFQSQSIRQMSLHSSGHFVILRMLQNFKYQDTKFIDAEINDYLLQIAQDHNGLRCIKTLLQSRSTDELTDLFKHISQEALVLSGHSYANYCVQSTLDVAPESMRTEIKLKLQGKFLHLSKQKFSSNVVEKCLRQSSSYWRNIIIKELIIQPGVESILTDRYGNFVLQTALEVAEQKQVEMIYQSVIPYLSSLRNSLQLKWKTILNQAKNKYSILETEIPNQNSTDNIHNPDELLVNIQPVNQQINAL